jgi:mono/diheme cytochrome c family protein
MRITLGSIVVAFVAMVAYPGVTRAVDVDKNYTQKCSGCHGSDGKADTPAGKKFNMKDLTDPKVQAAGKDPDWEKLIIEGVSNAEGRLIMPAYASRVSPESTKALVRYCRDFRRK